MWRELYWLPARRLEEMDTFRFCPTCGGPLGSRSLKAGDPERLVCGQCGFVFYLDPKVAVGTIITADGWQAAGTTLMALRAIIHALRGWPTPFGAALNAGAGLFDEAGDCKDQKDAWQLATVAEQEVEFAQMKAIQTKAAHPAGDQTKAMI